jgi:uncharacterized circularly permuted ATP-grasp superfamily protein
MQEKGDSMKKGVTAGKQKKGRPDWRLMEETAIHVDFGLKDIARRDNLGLASPGFKEDRMLYEYVVSISRSIAAMLERENPGVKVESTQLSGDDMAVNTLTSGATQVIIRHTRTPNAGLSVMVLGEGDTQKKIADLIRELKRSLES